MFAGINMFLARLRLILARAQQGLKVSLRRAKNIFMPKNINCITIKISLKGKIRHKNIKIDCKQSNSRLSVSCIYFVVLLTTNCLFGKQKKTKIIFKIQKEE